MAHRGPVITAVVVLGGLVGFMTANAAGGLVVAGEQQPAPAAETAPPTSQQPPPSERPPSAPPPSTTSTPEPPPPPALPPEAVYAGNATGTKLAIAVAVKGEEATGYLCDGSRVEAWLRGTATAGQIDLTSKDGSSRLLGGLAGANLTGSVTVAGQDLPFTIGVAAPPAGLYRGSDGTTTVGWIILPDGSQVGIATVRGNSTPAPELDPAAGGATVNGSRVTAEKIAGDSSLGAPR